MNILNITKEPSSSNWWKQRQRPAVAHWAELPVSSWRVGGVRIWAKMSRPWWGHPLKQFTWANGSLPTLARQGRNQHRPILATLNVGESCMAGADCWATGSGTRIYPYCLYWLFGTYFLWIDTLLSLDIVGRALYLPQSNVPYPLWGVDGDEGRWKEWKEGREWELGLVVKWKKKIVCFFTKIK